MQAICFFIFCCHVRTANFFWDRLYILFIFFPSSLLPYSYTESFGYPERIFSISSLYPVTSIFFVLALNCNLLRDLVNAISLYPLSLSISN